MSCKHDVPDIAAGSTHDDYWKRHTNTKTHSKSLIIALIHAVCTKPVFRCWTSAVYSAPCVALFLVMSKKVFYEFTATYTANIQTWREMLYCSSEKQECINCKLSVNSCSQMQVFKMYCNHLHLGCPMGCPWAIWMVVLQTRILLK